MDPLSMVEDEVALEGLDGITIPSLWIRLGDRKPKFPLKMDDGTKELVWRSLVANSDLTFHLLPAERDDVVLYDRFKMSHEENDEDKKDVYPLHIIQDNKDGIQGSCATFCQRTDVTARLRSSSPISVDEVFKRYGRKLVAVASQRRRFLALIGSEGDPDTKLLDDSYCMLERVGRARWQGELQSDLHKSCFKVDSRKLHYIRKALDRHGLVCTQACTKRLKTGQGQSSILLMLKRFHIIRRSKYDVLMEYVSTLLQKMPRQLAAFVTIREHLKLPEQMCKRVFRYMRDAKLVEYCSVPLEELDEEGGALRTRRGKKVQVRCLKLIKPYTGKVVTAVDEWKEDEDEDEDDEDDKRRAQSPVGRLMEKDLLSQAYKLIVSSGTEGIAQSGIASRMNVGKLEARMLWRKLERDGVIKGFMVDEGRQRVTKFISHRSVGGSDHLHLLSKEKQRKKLFHSSTSPMSASTPKASAQTQATGKRRQKTPKKSSAASEGEDDQVASLDLGGKVKKKSRGTAPKNPEVVTPEAAPTRLIVDTEPDRTSEQAPVKEKEEDEGSLPLCQEEEGNAADPATDIVVVDSVYKQQISTSSHRMHETYRMLRRKNLITEAIHKLKVIDGLYQLQRLINDEEKRQGFTTKCCKKTTARLVQTLSREGLLKIFTTTVIQDGISRKLEMFVHPSVQPKDELVSASIDQVRFKITSSCVATCQQAASNESPPKVEKEETSKSFKSFTEIKKEHSKEDGKFKPTTVRGLGKTLGFQPKMHRLRVLHTFLWYVIYDHPMGPRPSWLATPQEDPPKVIKEPLNTKDDDVSLNDLDAALSGDDDEAQMEISSNSKCEIKVYSDEDSWKRFVPPVRTHSDRDSGWVIVGDLLLCLPLSIFIQLIQINYQVDGLEEYLNDPVKQHYLIRQLPLGIRKKLFYKRKYVFVFFENLQRLVCMGLLQFAPVEKLKEKDQLFCYLKRHATIVDTINTEPHYWLVVEPADKPFDRRRYTFNSTEDVDTYWFDLMCVCLNTPLGLIRPKRGASEEEVTPSFVHERSVFVGMGSLLKGSYIVSDDGTTPGDRKGAAGLDSEFFAHLKRNWLWTNRLLACEYRPSVSGQSEQTRVRLKSLMSKEALRAALKAGASSPRFLTAKKSVVTEENVEVAIEPSSRNQQVVGGKRQKRKRPKKEVVRVPRKKKKAPKKRTPAHDEADHQALKKMTRQRVIWAVQEDSLLMLCGVASHLLNSKLRRMFVAHCVVRDLLQEEFQISEDKTSVAVGRRTRYILKNPQTFLNYRICLAEIYQDKDLMKQLEDNKPANSNNAEMCHLQDCAKAFSEYVKLLRHKFSSVVNADDVKLPDSKHQLFSQFKVCAIDTDKQIPCRDTLTCTMEIHALVLFNLIQSTLAMTNYQMKYSRSFQTFHIYSKYPQELLCQVFIQCRKRHLVNRRRVCQSSGPKKNRALPILPMSFQLSQSYFRLFSWRFPHTLCTESFRFLKTLLTNGTGDNRPSVSYCLETESSEEVPKGETKEAEGGQTSTPEHSGMMQFPMDSPGGACMASLTLMSLGLLSVHVSIPKKMVVVDSNLVDSDVKSMVSLVEEDEEDDDLASEECEGKKKMQVKAQQASHTKFLLMKGFCIPGIVQLRNQNTSDNIVVESCMLRMQLRQTPVRSLLKEDGAPLDFSKTGPALLPSVLTRCFPSIAPTPARCSGYSPEDLRASAQLRKSLDGAGDKGADQMDLFRELAHLCVPQPGRSRSLQQYLEDLHEEGQVLKVGGYGIRWVLTEHAEPWILTFNPGNWSQPQGTPSGCPSQHNIPFLRKRLRPKPRRDGDKEEEPPGKKAATGERLDTEERPVEPESRECAGTLLTGRESNETEEKCHSTEDKAEGEQAALTQQADLQEESMSFVSRPWRLVDGTLNRQVCKGMLEGVLYHIMSRPGIPQWRLLSYYEGVLQPVVVLELVQSLLELGCVTKRTLVKRTKPALFGPPTPREPTTEERECVFYEPMVSCCLRLAQVLPNERHWNHCGS
ncbi:general transcription factor 3C polypeptide 1 isoform X1 [Phyllopteryx taeniolatus]|uniref:general transcription factor 3C polypeptide 1 isoform X1 n=1 Tax=Phyllopteryx taeniolatus TaxID=161469 RepID=UPI002AD30141|nr:general transcription factor 3C polypeptide 1 isoform X1 [Phyllopteryx taeniolatus]